MTNRKSYNSILFLTVYLGLVLVGGSSHVFAHAATNSLFDLRNEIEFKEDLDNKPDDSLAGIKTDEENVQSFVEYIKLVSDSIKTYRAETSQSFLQEDISAKIGELKSNKNSLLSKLNFNSNFKVKNIALETSAFNQSLNFQLCKSRKFPEKVIYENTKVSSENNQVFIVTRLPRASIDSLLK